MTATLPDLSRTARKRRQVLRAAKAQFFSQGFSATRMEQVARDADVSSATVYSYFPSKEDLFKAVVLAAVEPLLDRLDAHRAETGSALSRLTAFAADYATFLSMPDVRAIFRLVAQERERFPELTRHVRIQMRDLTGGALGLLLEDLSAAGEITLDDPAMAVAQMRGMIEHTCLLLPLIAGVEDPWLRPPEQVAREAALTFMARYGVKRA